MGASSIQYVVKGVRYLLYRQYGIDGEFYEGDYNGIEKALMDENSEYFAFRPEVTILLPDSDTVDIDLYQSLWKRMPGYILQANFVVPNITALGNLEANVLFSRSYRIAEANLELVRRKHANVTILDLNGLASRVGTDRWFDYPAYFSTKQGFCLDFLPEVCALIVRHLAHWSEKPASVSCWIWTTRFGAALWAMTVGTVFGWIPTTRWGKLIAFSKSTCWI